MEYIATSKNNIKVHYDKYSSHAATHLKDTPKLIDLLKEIIPQLILKNDYIEYEHDFGKSVGLTDLVTNKLGDKIVYAVRRNRNVLNPFNKSQKPQPCNYVSFALSKTVSRDYILVSAYVGRQDCPPFPDEPHATSESRPFWNKHSLAFGTQEIQKETLTEVCPW